MMIAFLAPSQPASCSFSTPSITSATSPRRTTPGVLLIGLESCADGLTAAPDAVLTPVPVAPAVTALPAVVATTFEAVMISGRYAAAVVS